MSSSTRSRKPRQPTAGLARAGYPGYSSFWSGPRALLLGLPLTVAVTGAAYGDASLPGSQRTPAPRLLPEHVPLGGDVVAPIPPRPPTPPDGKRKEKEPCPVELGGKMVAPRTPPPPPRTAPAFDQDAPERSGARAVVVVAVAVAHGGQADLTHLHPHEPHEPCFVAGARLVTLRLPTEGDA